MGSGSSRMIKSIATLGIALPSQRPGVEPHFPSRVGFQLFAIGLHMKALLKTIPRYHAMFRKCVA